MASAIAVSMPPAVGPETLIRVKVTCHGDTYKTKLPLAELVPSVLPAKLQALIGLSPEQSCTFQRYSDSSSSFVDLQPDNAAAYKTLYRAAKAKLRLNIRATLFPSNDHLMPELDKSMKNLAKLNLGSTTTLASTLAPPASESSSTLATAVPEPVPSFAAYPRSVTIETVKESTTSNAQATPETPASAETVDMAEKPKTVKLSPPNGMPPRKFPTFTHYSSTNSVRTSGIAAPLLNATYSWSVYCNNCDKNMLNEHYHCNICDEGDFDLCVDCKNTGVHCRGEDHWLIKRFLDAHGTVISSTTETVGPRSREKTSTMPGAFTDEKKPEELEIPSRTCNSCIKAFSEDAFVTCVDCEDFDLCVPCLRRGKHGHHPAHEFKAVQEATVLNKHLQSACKPGRAQHHHAICDECDENISGVRHKCLTCPDWDYCSECIVRADAIHPGHRFAKIYDPIAMGPMNNGPVHYNIHCDGPLCTSSSGYIRGIRYKCVVCNDVDFCASCEATPQNGHNKTHPLLKIKSPVRGCNIETVIEEHDVSRHVRAVAAASAITNSATKIRTVVDVQPTEAKATKDKIEIKDLLSDPVPAPEAVDASELQATFVREAVADETTFPSGHIFFQTWTVKNSGTAAWPSGCLVRYVGGDNMLNVDDARPSCDLDVTRAVESNTLGRAVQPGEEVTFRVILKAPKRVGTAISYWRIKTNDGIPFGRRLWCHINVVKPTPAGLPENLAEDEHAKHQEFFRQFLQHRQKMQARDAIKCRRDEEARKISEARLQKLREELQARASKFPTLNDVAEACRPGSSLATGVTESKEEEKPVTRAAEEVSIPAPAPVEPEQVETKPEVKAEEDYEIFDDAESVSLGPDSDGDDGFVTDEEYDILDASDSEEPSKSK